MDSDTRELLVRMLDAPGPSGYEAEATAVWRAAADDFAARTWADVHGNSFAEINPAASFTVMLAGHADEIGLMVNHIDDDGFLWVVGVGGWDPQVLVGQRVNILASGGLVSGVVGRRAVHMIKGDDKEK
ncbi:MAG: M42 family peptidase, partial [Gemmatimonadota bacterium]|nr:M42 family peptidase [Gemmatimonadota bacterium]